jgi:hypothetical protein
MNMLPCRNHDSQTDADDADKSLPINNIPDEAGKCAFLYACLATSVFRQLPP